MRNLSFGLIGLCLITIVYHLSCGDVCKVRKLNERYERELEQSQTIYSGLIQEASSELLKIKELKNKVELGSGLVAHIEGRVYAGWDEPTTGVVSKMEISGHSQRDQLLMDRVCKHGKINGLVTTLCNNRDLYYTGKKIFEDRGVPYGIALGIMFAESHIGINYAGSCDSSWNNWGGIKWRKNDDGTSTKDQQIPNSGNCYLYKFDSIEDYFKSKANTLGLGYKSCFSQEKPITCISYAYVGNRYISEDSRVKRVALIAE